MRPQRSSGLLMFCALAFLVPGTAQAGMTMPKFTDIASARIEVISFFLVSYLALAFIYQRIWNSLVRDFQRLPRLSYRGALAALVVCGLFVYVVLTMISGARELMTPGAWARIGSHYKIREPEKDPKPWLDTARRASLEKLRAGLWRYAEQHGGNFPTNRERADLPEDLWQSVDPNGLQLIYVPGAKPDTGRDVVAHEPGTFGPNRLALLSDGKIVEMEVGELKQRVKAQVQAMDSVVQLKKEP